MSTEKASRRFVVTRRWRADDGSSGTRLNLWCPACEELHRIEIQSPERAWQWDGSRAKPTISPSILVTGVQWAPGEHFHKANHDGVAPGGQIRCHSFVRNGVWEYLADSTHSFAGRKDVPMEPLPGWLVAMEDADDA